MLFTGIHSCLLMEISAIRLKMKGFNAQRKEAKAMKVHGLKKQQNNKRSRYISEPHYIGKYNAALIQDNSCEAAPDGKIKIRKWADL